MRKLIIILSFIVLGADLAAQSTERRGYIGMTMGPSIPIGNFADNALNNSDAGFAKTGFNINVVDFGYRLVQNLSITASWFGATNSANVRGVDGVWSYGGFFVGPMLSFPVREKLLFDLKCKVGYVSATSDVNNYEVNSGTGVAFDLGGALRYNLSEKWSLLFNGALLASNPKLDTGRQKISSINLSFGLAYRLK